MGEPLSLNKVSCMRYFLEFCYNGQPFHGWQKQPNASSVQEVLETHLSTFLRTEIALTAAGRTDTGVHARQMFAHFDLKEPVSPDFVSRINNYLPSAIAIQNIHPAAPDAHARFDALERTYQYWISTVKDPFLFDFAHYLQRPPDIHKMNQAAALLLDFEDFKCFSKSNTDVKTYLCNIVSAGWRQEGSKLVFTITADRFLRNMVRAIVGTLLEVGKGALTPQDVKGIIKSRDRSEAGVSVPAKGLYLTEIKYPNSTFGNG